VSSIDLSLFGPVLRAEWFQQFREKARDEASRQALTGLVEGSRALTLTLFARTTDRRMVLVVPDDVALETYHRDIEALTTMLGGERHRIVSLPAMDADPYDLIPPHPEVAKDRVVALGRLARGEVDVLLIPARALVGWLPSPDELSSRIRVVHKGDELPPDRFVLEALSSGYRRVETVSGPGEFSRRGGIIDVFSPNAEEPVRFELFGDTVDSIRAFDTDHQRSTGELAEAVIGPAVESPPSDDAIARLASYLEGGIERARDRQASVRVYRERLEQLQTQGYLPGIEALAGITAARPVTIFEHAAGMMTVVDEPEKVAEEIDRAFADAAATYEESGDRILPPPARLLVEPARIRDRLKNAPLLLYELEGEQKAASPDRDAIHVPTRTPRSYAGNVHDFVQDLRASRSEGARVVCVMRADGSAERLGEILQEYHLEAALSIHEDAPAVGPASHGGLFVVVGGLRAGFEIPGQAFVVLTEREIFGKEKKGAERKSRAWAAFVSDFRDLKEGGNVVHVDHGIARYAGLGRPKGGSLNRDFMVLEFSGGDRLFVPVDRLDLVQKYSGSGDAKPTLDKLGGSGWERVKTRVRKSVQNMARELLELYARRKNTRGHAFSADTAWQTELESAFPYDLTPDQERAVRETKEDMERSLPMDRLLVGDVGFGKTEVAVRAAFKAVMDGFQVAVLAPTTVLAAQHHRTFVDRYAPFPVRVEVISRFRSPSEVKKVLKDVETGDVDVLIGTHRLLSKDVRFRRLGLLVVDEEQRFGVAHKEKLKKLSLGVDVIAMTATPIPRTLQMSLAGVRDLSVIETPPPGRTAIHTSLLPFKKNVIAQAIRTEVRRGGQVFFVHNRIDTLPSVVRMVGEMVPEARVVMGHGKLAERQLETVMMKFVQHEADVLVTTTIIENGLDIPRANTIVVNRADRFGLAQLYQLRGRVGRSEQRAYAFFIVPGRDTMTDEVRKRLRALQEFSELGAGFRLAAADLEIRGAGEFLGSKQHGHIAALGFDLYCQMLERAVQELKGEPVEERQPAGLHLGIDIKIPESYIGEAGERLALYKRLALAAAEADVDRLQSEIEDRYGHLAAAGLHLFDMARLRLVAERAGVKSVDVAEGKLQIRFHEKSPVEPARIVDMVAREKGSMTPSGMLLLPAPPKVSDRITTVHTILTHLLGKTAA
jgi:transcription-repair coupling factor (superfamily II helicase)